MIHKNPKFLKPMKNFLLTAKYAEIITFSLPSLRLCGAFTSNVQKTP
jgi:hypothetical protein